MKKRLCVAALAALVMIAPAHAWDVHESEDSMTGKKLVLATVTSTNMANFSWPYHGETRSRLTVRKHPRYGQDVMFSIPRGQFVCGVDGCTVLVRFDDRPPIKFGVVGSEDNDSKTLFFSNTKKFIGELRKSKRVRVAATVYQEGQPMFEFDTSGFDLK